MPYVITPAGERHDLPQLSLATLQEAVGGYIEIVASDASAVLIGNEEGRLLGLPHNMQASTIARRALVGNIVLFSREEWEAYNASDEEE